jgi:hypothetical protein
VARIRKVLYAIAALVGVWSLAGFLTFRTVEHNCFDYGPCDGFHSRWDYVAGGLALVLLLVYVAGTLAPRSGRRG